MQRSPPPLAIIGGNSSQGALEIGVECYLGKPYQEADLLRNVQETLKLSRA